MDNDAVAFLSYVRADDEHERGRITNLRERLEGEVRFQTGRPFHIFQDKKDIVWGQQWKQRLDSTLLNVTFLIPVVTPGYFKSTACRDEFEKFLLREKQLGENNLILPIYYLETDEILSAHKDEGDAMAKIIADRNWADWRGLRFQMLGTPEVDSALAKMALTIKSSMKNLDGIIAASKAKPPSPSTPLVISSFKIDLSNFNEKTPIFRPFIVANKPIPDKFGPYYSYTDKYDEELVAGDLSSKTELVLLWKYVNKTVFDLKRRSKKIIEITKKLKSIDAGRLPVISLIIDNSGSMRGQKIICAAAWAYIISSMLDDAEIRNEVLGFTTRAWKGGQSRESWLMDGKPDRPGRLNDLRHIIYKDFATKTSEACDNFGLMAREGLLKENIDGEALLWAYSRIEKFSGKNKIIIMVSDGEPIDDSTLSVNSGNFLDKHLRSTVAWLTEKLDIDLYGVGVGFNAGLYYKQSFITREPEEWGLRLIDALPEIISKNLSGP